jgi:F-type H+-transporting ATPase subunit b
MHQKFDIEFPALLEITVHSFNLIESFYAAKIQVCHPARRTGECMDEILRQLGGLLVGSVPTMVIFLFLLAAYRLLVHGPLHRVLDERRARTSGAIEKARAAITAAEERTAEYERKLREARLGMLKAREQRVQQWQAEREAAVESARNATRERVKAALQDIDKSAQEARLQMEASIAQLAAQAAQAVLPAAGRAQ